MAFPTIPTVASGDLLSSTTTTASATHTFPNLSSLRGGAGPQAGDLLIAICVQYQGGSNNAEYSSWGASFSEILDDSLTTGTGNGALGVAYKTASGSESGTFTVTSANSFRSVNFLMRIPAGEWQGTPEVQAATRAAGAVSDPASFSPSWGASDTLWVSVAGQTETSTTGSPPTLDADPVNFTGELIVARSADAVGHITAGVSFRQQNAASQDVGTWTASNANRGNGIATVIAIRSAPATQYGVVARATTFGAVVAGDLPRIVPSIIAIAEGTQTSDSSTWTLSYPAGATEGRLIIFMCSVDGNPGPSSATATNFTTSVGVGFGMVVGKRIVPSGGLSGTFTLTLNDAQQGAWKVLCISPWDGTVGINWTNSDSNGGSAPLGSVKDGTGDTVDLFGFSPFGWDASVEETLYILGCFADGGDTTFTDIPDNYSLVGNNLSSGGADGAALSVVSRQIAAEPEDPTSWTLSSSVVYRSAAIGVRGGTSGKDGATTYYGEVSRVTTFTKAVSGIILPQSTAVAEISLASHGEPTERTSHSIKIRARTTSGSTGVIKAALYEGTTNRSGDLTSIVLTNSLADYTLAIADVDAEDITDYSDLSIKLWGYAPDGGSLVFEVAELYLELPESAGPATFYGTTSLAVTFGETTAGITSKKTSVAEISLASYGTPVTRTQHSIRIRARTTSGSTGVIRAALYEGSNNRSGDLSSSLLSTSLSLYSLTIPDAAAETITDYSNLSIRLWGFDGAGNALEFEVAEIYLSLPEAGAATYYGIVTVPVIFTKDIIAQRQTFSQVAASLVFTKAFSGIRTTFGQIVAPFTFAKEITGRLGTFGQTVTTIVFTKSVIATKATFGQIVAPFIFFKETAGLKTTFGQIIAPFTFVKNVIGQRTTFGQISAPFVFAKVVAGVGTVINQISASFTFNKNVSGTRETFGQIALPFIFTKIVSGTKQTFGQIVAPFTFAKSVSGALSTFGSISTPFTFVKNVVASKTTFGQIVAPFIFAKNIIASKTTFSQTTISFTFTKATSGIRTTFSQITASFTFSRMINGIRSVLGQIVAPFTFVKNVIGQRTTLSQIIAPFIFNKTVSGRKETFGQSIIPVTFVKEINGKRTTFSQLIRPLVFNKDVSAHKSTFAQIDLPVVFLKEVTGTKQTFAQIAFPITALISVVAEVQGLRFGETSMSLVFNKETSGQRQTFGQTASPYVFVPSSQATKTTFGAFDRPFVFVKETSGQRKTFGQIAFPINATFVVTGVQQGSAQYGQLAMGLVFAEQTDGHRETLGQIVAPYLFATTSSGSKTTFGQLESSIDFIINVETGQVEAFSSLAFEILLGLEAAGFIRPASIILNLAQAVYLGSTEVEAVYIDSQNVWSK